MHVLSGFVQLKSVLFNLLRVFNLFFRALAVSSVSDFLIFYYLPHQVCQNKSVISFIFINGVKYILAAAHTVPLRFTVGDE